MSLSPERWQRIDSVFSKAADLPPAEREAYLATECADDPDLLREVQSMLAAEATAPLLLESMVSDAVSQASNEHLTSEVGTQMGAYLLTALIGSGGMGSVFKAVRADATYSQAVAIKLVHRGMNTDSVLARFRMERQILANLNHPNIARILDAGTAPDGRPYFVMEYVDGLPLLKHATQHQLTTTQRLELFLQVCAAVQHAHQNLVIHRDIKPGNILMTQDGVPKLLDFGIAKLLAQEESTSEFHTRTTGRFMTPEYASPEQVLGQEITTRADVYSLGVILYELLTGQKAYRASGKNLGEIERAVVGADPTRPSSVAAEPAIRRQLRGDLDNIVLLAMRKEPERRYASPQHLAEDIRNYLDGRPVSARQDSLSYRVGKLVRRNKAATAAVALLALSLIGGIVATTYQARRAERRFAQVRKLANTFLFDFYTSIERIPGTLDARALVLRTARDYLDSLAAEAVGDPALSLELAQAYLKLGDVEGGPQSTNRGNLKLAMEHYEKAQALLLPLRSPQAALNLATAYRRIGDYAAESSNIKGAGESYARGLALKPRITGRTTDPAEELRLFGALHNSLGRTHFRMLELDKAIQQASDGMRVLEQLLKLKPDDSSAANALASSYNTIGATYHRMIQLEQALPYYRKAIGIREELLQKNPRDIELRRDLAIAYSNLADVLGSRTGVNLGDPVAGVEMCRRMVSLTETAYNADPKDQRAQYDYGMSLTRLADMLPHEKAKPEALQTYQKAFGLFEQISLRDRRNRRVFYQMATTLRRIGDWQQTTGDLRAAEREYRRAAAMDVRLLEEDSSDFERVGNLQRSHRALSALLAKAGNCESAMQVHRSAVALLQPVAARLPNELRALALEPQMSKHLGDLHTLCGDTSAARQAYETSVQQWAPLKSHKNFGKAQQAEARDAETALAKWKR